MDKKGRTNIEKAESIPSTRKCHGHYFLGGKIILFHKDTPPSQEIVRIMVIDELKFDYSPDLDHSEFKFFPNHKKFIALKKYGSVSEVIAVTNVDFTDLAKTTAKKSSKHRARWSKCISVQAAFVEK